MAKNAQKLDCDRCGICGFCHLVLKQYKCYVEPAKRDEVTEATIRGVPVDPHDPPCKEFERRAQS